ncbi:MAG: hypothetical protein AB7F96_20645, partial [Beijerinckiaceae bacterium]
MLKALQLENYNSDVLLLLLCGIAIAAAVIGFVTDSVMGDRGFGPVGNGLLVLLGAIVGVYVRNAYFGLMQPGDLAITGIFAAASATLLLMLLGLA